MLLKEEPAAANSVPHWCRRHSLPGGVVVRPAAAPLARAWACVLPAYQDSAIVHGLFSLFDQKQRAPSKAEEQYLGEYDLLGVL